MFFSFSFCLCLRLPFSVSVKSRNTGVNKRSVESLSIAEKNSLVCWFYTRAVHLILSQSVSVTVSKHFPTMWCPGHHPQPCIHEYLLSEMSVFVVCGSLFGFVVVLMLGFFVLFCFFLLLCSFFVLLLFCLFVVIACLFLLLLFVVVVFLGGLHCPFREIRVTLPGYGTAAARAALPIPTSVCNVFMCPNNGTAASVWEF